MKSVDLHVHTLASPCGLHSLLEIMTLAREGGLKLLAITDHDGGPGTRIRVLGYRVPREWQGLRLLAGIEFSIRDGGALRVPPKVRLADLDICLAGFHEGARQSRDDPKQATDDLEHLLATCPWVDVISHPTIRGYDLEHDRAARLAAAHGVALEINNSSLRYGKESQERLSSLLAHCRQHRTLVAVNSDAHTAWELGADELAAPLVARAGLAPGQLITESPERALAFVDSRRQHKR